MSAAQSFYEIRRAGDVDVLRFTQSKLGYPALADLQKELDERIDAGSRKLLIDLAAVSFVDSFAVGIIAAAARRMESAAGSLKLCGVGERVHMSLAITRLDRRLEIHPDETAALESFRG
jgi:anti-sigma B factor antagonist